MAKGKPKGVVLEYQCKKCPQIKWLVEHEKGGVVRPVWAYKDSNLDLSCFHEWTRKRGVEDGTGAKA